MLLAVTSSNGRWVVSTLSSFSSSQVNKRATDSQSSSSGWPDPRVTARLTGFMSIGLVGVLINWLTGLTTNYCCRVWLTGGWSFRWSRMWWLQVPHAGLQSASWITWTVLLESICPSCCVQHVSLVKLSVQAWRSRLGLFELAQNLTPSFKYLLVNISRSLLNTTHLKSVIFKKHKWAFWRGLRSRGCSIQAPVQTKQGSCSGCTFRALQRSPGTRYNPATRYKNLNVSYRALWWTGGPSLCP